MRHHWMRRSAAAALAVCLLAQGAAAQVLHRSSLRLSGSLSLDATYSQQEENSVREKILTYQPTGRISPPG